MRQGLASHAQEVRVAAVASLVLAITLGGAAFALRRPASAPIVILPMTPAPTAPQASTSTPPPILVYVLGAVTRPGVYALPWDSRVEQAISAAGGASDNADLVRVNLAQRLYDEQQLYIPRQGEQILPMLPTAPASLAATQAPQAEGPRININAASAVELETLPGIGPVLAQRIVDYREANGLFRTPADIRNVSGIGEGIFDTIRERIAVQ
jgi:competence protein ComEA